MEHTHFVSAAGLIKKQPRTSAESTEAAWFSPEDALEAVTFPLTRYRLTKMLAAAGEMYSFSFRRDPFQVTDELLLPIAK